MGRNAHIPAADTQQFIIEKSATVFNKKGFAGTSIADLEKVTGLTKGSIYANFKDKEEVYLEVFKYNYQMMKKGLLLSTEHETTAKTKLAACINYYLGSYTTLIRNGGCVLQNALVDSDDANPRLYQSARKALKSWKGELLKILEEGKRRNEFSEAIEPEEYAYYLIAVIEGAILVSKSVNTPSLFGAILSRLKEEIIKL